MSYGSIIYIDIIAVLVFPLIRDDFKTVSLI
jgi:hypothetical protein